MSQLKARITQDMKDAMRAKDSLRLGSVRLLLAAVKQREVDERIELSDEQVVAVVDKLIKQRRDAIAAYRQAQRDDLAAQEQAEADVLQAYLPQRLDEAEVQAAVQAVVDQLGTELGRAVGPQDMGRVMGAVKSALAGKADMAVASAAVKATLSRSA